MVLVCVALIARHRGAVWSHGSSVGAAVRAARAPCEAPTEATQQLKTKHIEEDEERKRPEGTHVKRN